MKLYKLSSLEDYKDFIREISEKDQPVFLYSAFANPHLILLSLKEVDEPDKEIDKLVADNDDDVVDENSPLFDDDDFDDISLLR